MIETIRLSEKARTQLLTLKRRTGLTNWNVLCRWAFCMSMAEPSIPPEEDIPADSSVEMTWRTFAGSHDQVYKAVLLARAQTDGIASEEVRISQYFRLHLHRGISYLVSRDIGNIAEFVALAVRGGEARAQ